MTCSACDNCYPITGHPVSSCGCNCDPCRKCCPFPRCATYQLIYKIYNDVSVCFSFPVSYTKNNPYNLFFKSLKKYTVNKAYLKEIKDKKYLSYINPLNDHTNNFLKCVKEKNKNNIFFLNFKKNSKKFIEVNKNYFLHIENRNNYFNKINYKKYLNFCYWNGSDWVILKSSLRLIFKKIEKKVSPFYVIFDNNFNVLKTDNQASFNIKNYITKEKNYEVNFLKSNFKNNLKQKQNQSIIFDSKSIKMFSSCPDCPPLICYGVSITLSRSGGGCGFCSMPNVEFWSRRKGFGPFYGYLPVGGGCVSIEPYSDLYLKCFTWDTDPNGVCIYDKDYSDGSFGFGPLPVLTECGKACAVSVALVGATYCPQCLPHTYQYKYDKKLSHKRKFFKKFFEENRASKKLR